MGHLKPQSQDTTSAMKYLWVLVLFSVAFADPEAVSDPKADADPYLLYGHGLGHYGGYYGYGLGYGHGYGFWGRGLWGRKRREADPAATAVADPNAEAEADPYLLYGGYYGHGLGHYGGYYGYGLGYGHGYGLW